VTLQPLAETCYVDLVKPRYSVRIVLGMYGEESTFVPLASSAPRLLPQHTSAASEPPRWHRLAPGRDESAAASTAPPRETSEILRTRALAGERATSGSAAWGHHGLQSERDDSVARRR